MASTSGGHANVCKAFLVARRQNTEPHAREMVSGVVHDVILKAYNRARNTLRSAVDASRHRSTLTPPLLPCSRAPMS